MGIELIERCVWCGKTVCRLPTGIWTHYYESSGDTHWRCYPEAHISTTAKPAGITVKLDGSPMETTGQRLRIRIERLEDRVCILEDEFDKMESNREKALKLIDYAIEQLGADPEILKEDSNGYVDDNLPSDSQHD